MKVVRLFLFSSEADCAFADCRERELEQLTPRIAMEILSHEAVVREAYQDVVGVWTWGVGVTEASGHSICPRYVDRPQTMRWCLEMYLRLLRDTYLPKASSTSGK